jgi:hypothetical protein
MIDAATSGMRRSDCHSSSLNSPVCVTPFPYIFSAL